MSDVISLDELPRYSPWPARLLGLSPWEQRHKTGASVTKEFEQEKWGPLLARAEQARPAPDLAEVERWTLAGQPCVALDQGQLVRTTLAEAQQRYRELVAGALARRWPASALCELGCGYGSIILELARRPAFAGAPVLAAEYTASGRALTALLARSQGSAVAVGACDFADATLTDLSIPPGALIFTSYATPYVPVLADAFVGALLARRPSAVVHLEPLYEHCGETLLGLLQRRYIELNDYNRNLLTLLRRHQAQGKLAIVEERAQVFGNNPFLPVSVLVWTPT